MKLKPYNQYSESTVPENPLRPAHWEVKPLKYLVAPGVGYKAGPFGSALITSKLNQSGEVAVLTPEDVTNGLNPNNFAMFLPDSRIAEMKAFEVLPRDVVFPIGGSLGRAAVMPTGCRGILHQRLARIRTNPDVLVPEFLRLLLSDYSGFKALDELERRGAILHHLTREQLLNRRVAIPTVSEQLAILTFVKAETSKVDTLIAKQEQLIATLAEDRIATITHAVTKGLDAGAEMKDSAIGWLGQIPRHWSLMKLRHIGQPVIGLTYSPEDVVDKATDSTLVLRSANIQGGALDLSDCVYVSSPIPTRLRIKDGDILLCSRNGSRALIGKNILIDKRVAGQSFGAFMTIFRSDYNPFLYWVFNSRLFDFQTATFLSSTINQLTTGNLKGMEVPFPPHDEQQAIVTFLQVRISTINALIAKATGVIETLREYRSALITDAVTGKIDVRAAA